MQTDLKIRPHVKIRRPDDLHVHLREGGDLRHLVSWTSRSFARAVAMPNLRQPVTTSQRAAAYKQEILLAVPKGQKFEPLMSLFLTDRTSAEDLAAGLGSGLLVGAKFYPARATTQSEEGVNDWRRLSEAFEILSRFDRPLQIHGEVTDPKVDVFDRELVFIENVLQPILRDHPKLKVVIEHITTKQAVQFVRQNQSRMAATITAHHLLLNRNAMFEGGFRPHAYCLPVAKREEHRLALVEAATSGDKCFFLGSDSAPHGRQKKESACGCAGIFSAPNLLNHYLEVFVSQSATDRFSGFASEFGAQFYGLPLNDEIIELVWSPGTERVPLEVPLAEDVIVPFRAGSQVNWIQKP